MTGSLFAVLHDFVLSENVLLCLFLQFLYIYKKSSRVSTLKEEEDTILYSFAVVSDETKGGSLPQSIF